MGIAILERSNVSLITRVMATCAFVLTATVINTPALAGTVDLGDVQLANGNATVSIDTGSQRGVYNWTVDDVENLSTQWFWYRVGSNDPERSIDTLELLNQTVTDTDLDDLPDTLAISLGGDGFEMQTKYLLLGGSPGSGVADLAEILVITNTSEQNLNFHLFQYSDFDLRGTPGDDTVTLASASRWVQQDGAGGIFSETVTTPTPSHFEAAFFPNTLESLTDGLPTTLADIAGPLTGNVTWTWQWDFGIAPGGSVTLSKNKNFVVPEPCTISLLALGACTVFKARRRKRRSS